MFSTLIRRVPLVAVIVFAACQDAPSASTGPDPQPVNSRTELPAQAQERLAQTFARVAPGVMELEGTVFADHDETRGKIVVGVEHAGVARAVVQTFVRTGIAAADYDVRVVPAIRFLSTLRDSYRPTRGGVQINFTRYVCSLGFNVSDGTEASFITNSHCTAKQGGVESTEYWQPSKSTEPSAVATEVEDPLYTALAGCSRGEACRYSDASRARYAAGVTGERVVAHTDAANSGSLTVTGSFSLAGKSSQTTFATGTIVNKVGRTTGWTRGAVTNSCATVNVSGSKVQLLCQTLVEDPGGAVLVGGGDSGSGVWTGGAGGVTAVGLLWGGSGDGKLFVFSPFANIERELGALVVK